MSAGVPFVGALRPRAMSHAALHGLSLLVLEDEPLLRKRYAGHLESEGAEVVTASTLREATEALGNLDFDVVVLDVNLPDGKGTDLLRSGKIGPTTSALVMTAQGGVSGAVEAMRLGAADYLTKPFDLPDLTLRVLRARRAQHARRAEEFRRDGPGAATATSVAAAPAGPATAQPTTAKPSVGRTPPPSSNAPAEAPVAPMDGFFFGQSLAGIQEQLAKILAADQRLQSALPPVLIEGETGTGKTTIARWIHAHGPRATGPCIEVNCSALPDALAESELFGHERGAFTDARAARIGLMEAADGGTLFLDELPSLPLGLQAKLLTALEDRAVRRVGANKAKSVDVRIIAATNADLRKLVAEGKFREDLLHRLDLFRVRIPPLRERGDDIVALAEVLLARIGRRYGLTTRSIPAEGKRRLRAHAWPGNVRELAHEIERAVVFEGETGLDFRSLALRAQAGTDATAGPLREDFVFPPSGFSLEATIDQLIQRALNQTGGNVTAAARLLGVTRDYVRYHLKPGTGESAPAVP
jgi:DNA-binding NtrC family response regulator